MYALHENSNIVMIVVPVVVQLVVPLVQPPKRYRYGRFHTRSSLLPSSNLVGYPHLLCRGCRSRVVHGSHTTTSTTTVEL